MATSRCKIAPLGTVQNSEKKNPEQYALISCQNVHWYHVPFRFQRAKNTVMKDKHGQRLHCACVVLVEEDAGSFCKVRPKPAVSMRLSSQERAEKMREHSVKFREWLFIKVE